MFCSFSAARLQTRISSPPDLKCFWLSGLGCPGSSWLNLSQRFSVHFLRVGRDARPIVLVERETRILRCAVPGCCGERRGEPGGPVCSVRFPLGTAASLNTTGIVGGQRSLEVARQKQKRSLVQRVGSPRPGVDVCPSQQLDCTSLSSRLHEGSGFFVLYSSSSCISRTRQN